jgi:hypothetical protein
MIPAHPNLNSPAIIVLRQLSICHDLSRALRDRLDDQPRIKPGRPRLHRLGYFAARHRLLLSQLVSVAATIKVGAEPHRKQSRPIARRGFSAERLAGLRALTIGMLAVRLRLFSS